MSEEHFGVRATIVGTHVALGHRLPLSCIEYSSMVRLGIQAQGIAGVGFETGIGFETFRWSS